MLLLAPEDQNLRKYCASFWIPDRVAWLEGPQNHAETIIALRCLLGAALQFHAVYMRC